MLSIAQNIRVKSAKINSAYVGVSDVPFNDGFYRITVKYYVVLELEGCVAIGRSETFGGLVVLEKDVILYGGKGSTTSYTSSVDNNYCATPEPMNVHCDLPVAVVETVEPIVLGYRVKECCTPCDCHEIPDCVKCCVDGELSTAFDGPRLYVSLGLFSVIRIERPTQLLIQATDYSVPDKECYAQNNNENPCDLFRTMAFPTSRFKTGCIDTTNLTHDIKGSCGCKKN